MVVMKLLSIFLFSVLFVFSVKSKEDFKGPFWWDFDPVNNREKSIVYLPRDYDPQKKYPLVISLHGFSGSAKIQNTIFDFRALTTKYQFILINPEGTKGPGGLRFWDATDFCCNFSNREVDDVEYIRHLIEGVSDEYSVEKERVYLFGHSNGGFLSYRVACDNPELIAGIASFSGTGWKDFSKCQGKEPVSILHLHGTKDFLIKYEGTAKFPGAEETVSDWVDKNNCGRGNFTTRKFRDLRPKNMKVPYLETSEKFWANCDKGTSVIFWSIKNGDHLITFNQRYLERLLDYLLSFRKYQNS
jgi:polyhydroxybutyrate depolymerase